MLAQRMYDDASGDGGGTASEVAGPPTIPVTRRRVQLYAAQWIGLPVLALLPLLAMLGVFDGTRRATAVAGDLEVAVDYPARIRAGQVARLEVVVRNRGPLPLEDVRVRFDPALFDGAANLLITPTPESPMDVRLPLVDAGGDAHVRVEFRWEHLWSRTGRVTVEQPDGTAVLPVRTFIFP